MFFDKRTFARIESYASLNHHPQKNGKGGCVRANFTRQTNCNRITRPVSAVKKTLWGSARLIIPRRRRLLSLRCILRSHEAIAQNSRLCIQSEFDNASVRPKSIRGKDLGTPRWPVSAAYDRRRIHPTSHRRYGRKRGLKDTWVCSDTQPRKAEISCHMPRFAWEYIAARVRSAPPTSLPLTRYIGRRGTSSRILRARRRLRLNDAEEIERESENERKGGNTAGWRRREKIRIYYSGRSVVSVSRALRITVDKFQRCETTVNENKIHYQTQIGKK